MGRPEVESSSERWEADGIKERKLLSKLCSGEDHYVSAFRSEGTAASEAGQGWGVSWSRFAVKDQGRTRAFGLNRGGSNSYPQGDL